MNNKQFAKALLKENGQTTEEKDRWIGTVIGQELTKYIESIFTTYDEIQMVARNLAPLNDWVEDKFKEITKRNPKDYKFEIISRPAFERWASVDFTVRFVRRSWRERMVETGTTFMDSQGISYAHSGQQWEQITLGTPYQPNYAEQMPSITLDANGIRFEGVTIIGEERITAGHQHTWQSSVQPMRVIERYGPSFINTGGIATVGNIDFTASYNRPVNATAVDGGTTREE